MAKVAFTTKKTLFIKNLDFKTPTKILNVVLEKDGEYQLDRSCEKRGSVARVKEKRNILHTVEKRKSDWSGHILRRNCLLKHFVEGKILGGIETKENQGIRSKQLLDDLKKKKG
jgi:hypothetical protein